MNLTSLYKLAALLDSQGKYEESDYVYDTMLKIAAPDGRGRTQGRLRPRDNRNFRLTPQQIQQRLNPNAPGLVPVQSTPPVAPQAPSVAPQAAAASRLSPKQMVSLFIRQNADMKFMLGYLNKIGYPLDEFAEAYDDQYGKGKFKFDFDRVQKGLPAGPNVRMPKVNPIIDKMSIKTMQNLLRRFNGKPGQLREFLAGNPELGRQFAATFDELNGPGAFQAQIEGATVRPVTSPQQPRGQQSGGQSSARPSGNNSSGNSGRGGTSTNSGANSAGAGARPSGAGESTSAGGNRGQSGQGTSAKPNSGTGSGSSSAGRSYRGPDPKFDPIPKDFNPISASANAAKYRLLIMQNPGTRPGIAARLEMLVAKGLLDPKTGNWTRNFNDIQLSELDRFYRNLGKAQDAVSDTLGRGRGSGGPSPTSGFSSASFAQALNNTKAGQNFVKSLYSANRMFTNVVSKIPPPALKVISKIKFVFIFLNFAKFMQALLNGTLEYKQTIEFIAACAAISPQVTGTLGQIPIVGPGLVIAIAAVNLGAADVVEFFGNPEAGLNYMGFQITGPSARRKTDQIDFSTLDLSTLDKSVQNALSESVPLIKNGLKIREILVDPGMVQRHPWLSKTDDIRFTQFSGALGSGGFYKQNKQQVASGNERLDSERKEVKDRLVNRQVNNIPAGSVDTQTQNQTQKPAAVLRNYNDLLYKAYVDVVKSTNITLDNMVQYKDQIIQKINNLAPSYPNINAQQSITLLENRIRKYSKPSPQAA